MKQIRESFAERNKPMQEQLRAKRQELRQASEGGTFSRYQFRPPLCRAQFKDHRGAGRRMGGPRDNE